MTTTRPEPVMAVIRAALRLVPADLRMEYGDEMLAVFRERCATLTVERGRLSGAWYVVRTAVNLITVAVAGHGARWLATAVGVLRACGQPGIGQDVRHAMRSLSRAWGFSAWVIGVLGAGLGLGAAALSIAYGVLLHPFPYRSPAALVRIDWVAATGQSLGGSLGDLEVWRQARHSLADLGPYSLSSLEVRDRGPAESVQMAYVGSRTLAILGIEAQVGRLFSSAEDVPNGDVHKAILSNGLWSRLFQRDPGVLGRTIDGGSGPLEIVGVMPPGFGFPDRTDLWVPIESRWAHSHNPGARVVTRQLATIGRLNPHATPEIARAELHGLSDDVVPGRADTVVRVRSLRDAEAGHLRPYVAVLVAAAGCLLLVCVMNVTSLQLARGLARGHEFAVRAAVGASMSRNLRTLLVENAMLVGAGMVVAAAVAAAGIRVVVAAIPVMLPSWMRLELNPLVLAASLAAGGTVSLLAGVVAVWHAHRREPQALIAARRANTDHARLRKAFIIAEVAAATVLVVMTGLLAGTLLALQGRQSGFRPEGVLAAHVVRGQSGTAAASPNSLQAMHERVIDVLASIPGVTRVAAASRLPMVAGRGSRTIMDLTISNATGGATIRTPSLGLADVTPGYFATIGIPLVRGRDFTAHDSRQSPRVVIVSERAAARLWLGQDPLGQQVTWGVASPTNPSATVVGIVSDVSAFAAEGDIGLDLYYPYAQYQAHSLFYVLRTSADPRSLVEHARRAIHATEPSIAVATIKATEQRMHESLWQTRLWGSLLGIFAGAALFLSAAGLYGLMSYLLGLRATELGIRISLGATANHIAGLLFGEMARLIAAGAVIGMVMSVAASRLVAALLFGVSPTDIRILVAAPLVVAAVSLLACGPPALRSRRLDVTLVLNGGGPGR
jgi:putative ABC transport system permease protein